MLSLERIAVSPEPSLTLSRRVGDDPVALHTFDDFARWGDLRTVDSSGDSIEFGCGYGKRQRGGHSVYKEWGILNQSTLERVLRLARG